eukprot:3476656-Amphidinium_carterae.1
MALGHIILKPSAHKHPSAVKLAKARKSHNLCSIKFLQVHSQSSPQILLCGEAVVEVSRIKGFFWNIWIDIPVAWILIPV